MSNHNDINQNVNETGNQDVEKIGGRSIFSKGFNYKFNVEGHEIHAWGSAKSGKEKVFVDGKLVSSKWSLTKKSIHTFKLNNDSYELEFNMVSLITSELHCILIKNGVHLETQKQVPKYSSDKKKGKTLILVLFVIGFLFGLFGVDAIISLFS
ncbi:hypothetical protein KO505_08705 [Psychrosphaera sp. F3M07]|uniref:hypothetical protein n=1 Tax=Psychrosphaera sp. F3M07 TaxID=2841560 RepID=UPI001C091EC7|nr:hypothetical protein [Psychrosphaera sp. F3M07]MBU2918040.1 hypothetical protein [Psychrosphaera sp. F3M07]